jgi:hypothetical protein
MPNSEPVRSGKPDLALEDVYAVDEMFCTGTMGELQV